MREPVGRGIQYILYLPLRGLVVGGGARGMREGNLSAAAGKRSKLLLSRWDGTSWRGTVTCLSRKLCKLKITPKLRSFVICRYTTFPRHVFVRSARFSPTDNRQ